MLRFNIIYYNVANKPVIYYETIIIQHNKKNESFYYFFSDGAFHFINGFDGGFSNDYPNHGCAIINVTKISSIFSSKTFGWLDGRKFDLNWNSSSFCFVTMGQKKNHRINRMQ